MHGGEGSDQFIYRSELDSSEGEFNRDTIISFESEDRIDLSGLDHSFAFLILHLAIGSILVGLNSRLQEKSDLRMGYCS